MPSQQIVRDELIAMLLGYCPDVCVIAPVKLKNKLEELLLKGVEVNRRRVRG